MGGAPVDHAVFVWDGVIDVKGVAVAAVGAVIVEHGGDAVIRAGSRGATLAHFHPRDDNPQNPGKAGGHVHVLDCEGIFVGRNDVVGTKQTLYADTACRTCEVWLKTSSTKQPRPQGGRHFHTGDEIIVITGGGMKLGRRTLGPGTALAIDAKTIYSFESRRKGWPLSTFAQVQRVTCKSRQRMSHSTIRSASKISLAIRN